MFSHQKIYVRCIYNIHEKGPTILENEPKYADPKKLTNFKMNATNARASILEYTRILRSERDGCARPGEEDALRIEEDGTGNMAKEVPSAAHKGKGQGDFKE